MPNDDELKTNESDAEFDLADGLPDRKIASVAVAKVVLVPPRPFDLPPDLAEFEIGDNLESGNI